MAAAYGKCRHPALAILNPRSNGRGLRGSIISAGRRGRPFSLLGPAFAGRNRSTERTYPRSPGFPGGQPTRVSTGWLRHPGRGCQWPRGLWIAGLRSPCSTTAEVGEPWSRRSVGPAWAADERLGDQRRAGSQLRKRVEQRLGGVDSRGRDARSAMELSSRGRGLSGAGTVQDPSELRRGSTRRSPFREGHARRDGSTR